MASEQSVSRMTLCQNNWRARMVRVRLSETTPGRGAGGSRRVAGLTRGRTARFGAGRTALFLGVVFDRRLAMRALWAVRGREANVALLFRAMRGLDFALYSP